MRKAEILRETKETRITLALDLDGAGKSEVSTGIHFFNHMLELTARHGLFDLVLEARGDLAVDSHHTVEDVGLVLGQGMKKALGDRAGTARYGWALLPMDEALVKAALDLGGRPFFAYGDAGIDARLRVSSIFPDAGGKKGKAEEDKPAGRRRKPAVEGMGGFSLELIPEFFQAFCNEAGVNLHIAVEAGRNRHHIAEGVFKAFARAFAQAKSLDPRVTGVPSTKGRIG
jgi:imidazoleglycerol-phosphate dehydratase